MTSITTRAGKGTPLTHTEVDDNFTNLNADKLEASNNLSDVSSASAARTNLGLGTAATTASTDYATAAQGSLADSAVQPDDDVSLGTVTADGLTVDTDTLHVDAANNRVGIGTSSPTGDLTIGGGSPRLDFLEGNGSAGFDNTILIRDADVFAIQTRNGGTFVSNDYRITANASGALTHEWRIGNSEKMRITSAGSVGIGTSSPDALFTVNGQTILGDLVAGSPNLTNLTSGTPPQLIAGWSVPAISWSPASSTEAVFTRDGNMQVDILAGANQLANLNFSDPDSEDVGQISYDHSVDRMRFSTNGSEVMRIDSAGVVEIAEGSVVLNGSAISAVQVTVADDAVAELTFTNRRFGMLNVVEGDDDDQFPDANQFFLGYADFGNSAYGATAIIGNNTVLDNTNTLTGTTGTDGKFTIGLAGTSGTLYLENRSGFTRTYNVTLL